jgi:hypothetical protein
MAVIMVFIIPNAAAISATPAINCNVTFTEPRMDNTELKSCWSVTTLTLATSIIAAM